MVRTSFFTLNKLIFPDLYKTNAGLKDVSRQYPKNALLAGRGPPGTHDVELAQRVLQDISRINGDTGKTVNLPVFDKSLCGGEGDRSTETVPVTAPLDVFILEGWSMGFTAPPSEELQSKYNSKRSLTDTTYFLSQPLASLQQLNDNLSTFAETVYPYFSTMISVVPESYQYVFEWRLQQERMMKAGNGGKGMTDEEVKRFVERYMPGYELWSVGGEFEGLKLMYGSGREIVGVEKVQGKIPGTAINKPFTTNQTSTSLGNTGSVQELPDVGKSVHTALEQPKVILAKSTTTTPTNVVENVTTKPIVPSTSSPSSSSSQPFNPNYSRKFLTSKSPLIPTYDQIPTLATLHPDSIILKTTKHLAFFPVLGPGGRIVVHPLKNKGRLDKGDGVQYLSAGVEVGDFDVEGFESDEGVWVAVAGEDGGIRVWRIEQGGLSGGGADTAVILKG
jgi:pantothenate kinase-related protein Tda10